MQVGNLSDAEQEVIQGQAWRSLSWCSVPWLMGPRLLGAALCATVAAEYGGPGVAGAVGEWGYFQFNGENRDKYVPGWNTANPPDLAAQTDGAIAYIRDQGFWFVVNASVPSWTVALMRGAWLLSLSDAEKYGGALGVAGAYERGLEALKTGSGELAQRMFDDLKAWVWGQVLGAVAAGVVIVAMVLAYYGALRWAGYTAAVGLGAVASLALGGLPGLLLFGGAAVLLAARKRKGRWPWAGKGGVKL